MLSATRSTRRTLVLATAAVALAGSLAACGSDSDSGSADITVYSGRSEELVGPLLEQFTEETGITVDARYGDSAELAATLLEEGDRTPADVYFSQDAGALGAVDAEDLLVALPDSVTSLVPAEYRAKDDSWVGVTGRARVIIYNTDQVDADEVPDTIDELTDPKWKGEIGIAPTNASFQAFVTALRVAEGEDAAKQWLEDLVANEPQIFDNNSGIRDAVDAGTVQLGLINHYYWFEQVAEVGADNVSSQLQFTKAGDVGSLVNVAGAGITTGGGDNPDAEAFVAYLLSESAQTYFAEETFEYPLVESVPAADGLPALDELQGPDIALADLSSLPVTLDLLETVGLT